MIDTKYLEEIISAVRSDKNLIHFQVRKVEKNPDYISIGVMDVSTSSETATLLILMGWQVDKFIRYSESWSPYKDTIKDLPIRVKDAALCSNLNTLRGKWFYSIIDKLNDRGEGRMKFFPLEWEFGAGSGCIWASVKVGAVEAEL